MSADRWEEIERLFGEVASLDPAERAARLAETDPAVRAEVESLVRASDAAGSEFLQGRFGGVNAGDRIDRYRIVERIGEGGMGEVYLAERADEEFDKRVALKIVGYASPKLVARFLAERQILARLEHEHIARLLDGGTTHGKPYVVMEHVEGLPIDEAADGMERRARLELFIAVCRAVHFAHRHLVVHRDLKPSNILVTPDGAPKLLDFGIAKLLDEDEPDLTHTQERALTPGWASPEQFLGRPVTTASDVYALGLLLYRMLTGRVAFQFEGRSVTEMVEMVTSRPPPPPEQGRDLDTILLKALRKEPERRYESAAALADDIEAFLSGRTVSARPDTWMYRVSMFVRRNKVGVAAGVALVAALAIGLYTTEIQRRRAERLFDGSRKFARRTLFELHETIRFLQGATRARETLVSIALEYLETLSKERGNNPELDVEVAAAYNTIGTIQGAPYENSLGDTDGALRSYQRARELAAGLGGHKAARVRGVAIEAIGDILQVRGELDASIEHQRQALAEYAKHGENRPAHSLAWLKLGDKLGNPNFHNAGDLVGAREAYERAVEIHGRDKRFDYITSERLGDIAAAQDRLDDAVGHYKSALDVATELVRANPENARFVRDEALCYEKLGNLARAKNDHEEALRQFKKAQVGFAKIAAADEDNANAIRSLTIIDEKIADEFDALNRKAESLALWKDIEKRREALVVRDPNNRTWSADLERARRRVRDLDPE